MSKQNRSNRAAEQAANLAADLSASAGWDALPLADREAIRIGQIVRERDTAREVKANADTLAAEGLTAVYTFPMKSPSGDLRRIDSMPEGFELPTGAEVRADGVILLDAREVLAEADRRAAKRKGGTKGRYTDRRDVARMDGYDLQRIALSAARLEVHRATRSGYVMGREQRATRADDLAADLMAQAFETTAGARMGAAGTDDDERGKFPRWDALNGHDLPGDTTRERWTSYLRRYARRTLDAERRAAEAEQRTPAELRAERTEQRTADATATADALAALMADTRPLGKLQRAGIVAALDGLTHRERAEAEGIKQEHAKANAAKGRAALAKRWPTATDLAADARRAKSAALAADLHRAALRAAWGIMGTPDGVTLAAEKIARTERAAAALTAWRRTYVTRNAEVAPVRNVRLNWRDRTEVDPERLTPQGGTGAATSRPTDAHGTDATNRARAFCALAALVVGRAVAPMHARPADAPRAPLTVLYPQGATSPLSVQTIERPTRAARQPQPLSATERYEILRTMRPTLTTKSSGDTYAERMRARAAAAEREQHATA